VPQNDWLLFLVTSQLSTNIYVLTPLRCTHTQQCIRLSCPIISTPLSYPQLCHYALQQTSERIWHVPCSICVVYYSHTIKLNWQCRPTNYLYIVPRGLAISL